jgi:hypothetical protein
VRGVFEFRGAWVISIAEFAGEFGLKPTPDAESGFVNLLVMRGVAYLAIGGTGNLGIVTHRALLGLKLRIDLLPAFYNTGRGKRNAVNPGYKSP